MSVRHLDRIREAVRAAGADALWVHPAVDFRYLTGLAPIAVERPTALLIPAAGELRVLSPTMLAPELEELGELAAWDDGEGPQAAIARVLDGVGRLLVEPDLPTGVAFALRDAGAELALDAGILAGLRERKAPDELELLRAAGREADEAMAWVPRRSSSRAAASAGSRSSCRRASSPAASRRTPTTSSPRARTARSRTTCQATRRSPPRC